ncbi:MAG: hypothetical protein EXS49_01960 [Candidatus Pacebacteria bacterium]|nr:hypothetical protein [Candidatus Paceibacterota bacterium]
MKKIISISIIAFSVFLGMVVIGRFSDSKDVLNTEALGYKIVDQEKNTSGNEGKFIESLADVKAPESDVAISETKNVSALEQNNITQQIANQIGQKMIGGAKDADSLMQDLKSGNPETIRNTYSLTSDLIAQMAKEISSETLKLKINSNQLNLITDNSKEARREYVSGLGYILSSKIQNNKMTSLDSKTLNDIYLQFDSAIGDLKKLRTPSDLFQFHSDTISILGGIRNGLSQIITTNSDPAKILIILTSMEELNKEFKELFEGASKLI